MVCVTTSSIVDRGFKRRYGQTKDNKFVFAIGKIGTCW